MSAKDLQQVMYILLFTLMYLHLHACRHILLASEDSLACSSCAKLQRLMGAFLSQVQAQQRLLE